MRPTFECKVSNGVGLQCPESELGSLCGSRPDQFVGFGMFLRAENRKWLARTDGPSWEHRVGCAAGATMDVRARPIPLTRFVTENFH
jgi:hypothetical protein